MSGARKDGRTKKRPGVDQQRRLVTETAVALFVSRGTQAVSVSQICDAADVSRPTFYRCFSDKDALVEHIYAIAVGDHTELNLAAVLREGLEPKDLRSELELMADRIFENSALAAFLLGEAGSEHSPAHAIVNASFDQAVGEIGAWYDTAGHAAPSPTTLKAIMVACQWVVHNAIRAGLTDEHRADAKQAMWQIVEAVFLSE